MGQPILDAVKAVTDKPVTMIINTHTHGDHTGSNTEFPTAVQIVAHANTKTNMQKMAAFKGANEKYLPNRTFPDHLSLLDGIDKIDLYYFGPGHTNGDAVVVFPAKRVAHMGDLFPSKSAPLIDTNNGGSGVAYPVDPEPGGGGARRRRDSHRHRARDGAAGEPAAGDAHSRRLERVRRLQPRLSCGGARGGEGRQDTGSRGGKPGAAGALQGIRDGSRERQCRGHLPGNPVAGLEARDGLAWRLV